MLSDPEESGTTRRDHVYHDSPIVLYETEETILRVVSLDPGHEFQGTWESFLQLTIDIEGCVTR